MEQSYKEKYEDILARLERAKNDNEVCDERFCCVIDDLIPELAESEDEKVRKGIIELVKQSSEILNKKNQERMLAWLEKQGEKKPEENKGNIGGISSNWSEEDKDFMYDTLSNLTELKDRYGEGYGNVGKCIDWLKSLRPQNHWKPSDRQIDSITCAVRKMKESACYDSELVALFNDLKKLKDK